MAIQTLHYDVDKELLERTVLLLSYATHISSISICKWTGIAMKLIQIISILEYTLHKLFTANLPFVR